MRSIAAEARRRPIAGGSLHDHDQHLGMRGGIASAEQSVDLLRCRLQSVEPLVTHRVPRASCLGPELSAGCLWLVGPDVRPDTDR